MVPSTRHGLTGSYPEMSLYSGDIPSHPTSSFLCLYLHTGSGALIRRQMSPPHACLQTPDLQFFLLPSSYLGHHHTGSRGWGSYPETLLPDLGFFLPPRFRLGQSCKTASSWSSLSSHPLPYSALTELCQAHDLPDLSKVEALGPFPCRGHTRFLGLFPCARLVSV